MKRLLFLLLLSIPAKSQFTNAKSIWARPIASTAPSDTQALVWSASNNRWQPGTSGGAAYVAVAVSAATVTLNVATYSSFGIALTANVTTVTISGSPVTGQTYYVIQTQDGTGGWTVAGWPSNWKGIAGPFPDANSITVQPCTYDGTNYICGAAVPVTATPTIALEATRALPLTNPASGYIWRVAATGGQEQTLDSAGNLNSTVRTATSLATGALPDYVQADGTLHYNTRAYLNPTAKTIVDGSATSLFDVACAASSMSGGTIMYQVEAGDGTDFQALSGIVTYAVVNKAASFTLTITEATANQAKAVSSGTLTLAWTFVAGTNKGTVKLQPTGSLTETTYRVTYTVLPMVGAVTLL